MSTTTTTTTKLDHVFWSRVLTEYDDAADAFYSLCYASDTFNDAYNDIGWDSTDTSGTIRTLAVQFLATTDFGATFYLGKTFLFRPYDPDATYQDRRAVRHAFLLWNIANTQPTTTHEP